MAGSPSQITQPLISEEDRAFDLLAEDTKDLSSEFQMAAGEWLAANKTAQKLYIRKQTAEERISFLQKLVPSSPDWSHFAEI